MFRHALPLLTAVAITSCGSPAEPSLPEREPLPAAVIVATDVQTSISQGRPTIHVKADVTEECGVVFTIREDTRIAQRTEAGSLTRAALDDLQVGRTVHVWAAGNVVLRSCPGQATAEAIELLPDRAW